MALLAAPAFAQADDRVVIKEHVVTVWADVLDVTPVLQAVTTSRNEQVCDGDAADAQTDSDSPGWLKSIRNLGRKVSNISTRDRVTGTGCRMVKVERQTQRPTAYDVDYVYRGMKFRTRLPIDPGSRLRIRIGVKPVIE